MVTIIRNYWVDFINHVDEMGENLSLSVGNTIEFGYKIIHNYRMLNVENITSLKEWECNYG
jgi:hypothetical protein